MKKFLKLDHLHCAGCAVALQDKINKVQGVNSAEINFVSRIVTLDIDSKDYKQTLKDVEASIHEFDKTICIIDPRSQNKEGKQKANTAKKVQYVLFGVSVALWIAAIILQFTLKMWSVHFSIYLTAYLLCGYPILYNAFTNIFKGKVLDENFLMTLATIGAFIIGEYMEGVAVIIFYIIGEMFQHKISHNSEKNISSLSLLKCGEASLVLSDGTIQITKIDQIKVGDIIVVNAGEKVPLDGNIISGGANFNTAAITGESVPQYLGVDASISSGYIAEDGSVTIKVTADNNNCTVSKIIDMVQEASASKANIEKFISRFARIYTPVVAGLAAILAFVMPAFWGYTLEAFKLWAYRGLGFLVVSCPCALVLGVPLTYFAGIGAMAKSGILVKGSNYIEKLAKANTIVFDKTGTLTTGQFEVTGVHTLKDKTADDILELVAYCESFSNHSIAKSVVEYYSQKTGKTINTAWVQGYKEVAGGGITASIFMEECVIGNADFIKQYGELDLLVPAENETQVYLLVAGKLQGYITLADTLKPDAKEAIKGLKAAKMKTVMLTGDNIAVASTISTSLGLNGFYAGLKPAQKVEKIKELSKLNSKHKCVAFVGDGINDAPALTSADVGIAMGGLGSDIAIESADMVIMTDEPSKLVPAKKIAKNTMNIVYQNIVGSIAIKVVTMLLLSFGLANMWLAVFADTGLTVLAILNSLRATKRYKSKIKNAKN